MFTKINLSIGSFLFFYSEFNIDSVAYLYELTLSFLSSVATDAIVLRFNYEIGFGYGVSEFSSVADYCIAISII